MRPAPVYRSPRHDLPERSIPDSVEDALGKELLGTKLAHRRFHIPCSDPDSIAAPSVSQPYRRTEDPAAHAYAFQGSAHTLGVRDGAAEQ